MAEELHRRAVLTLNTLRMGGESFIRPSAPPALLSSLTDHLLVVASDAISIKAVASSNKEGMDPVSGKDQYRLLAWTPANYTGMFGNSARSLLSAVVVDGTCLQ